MLSDSLGAALSSGAVSDARVKDSLRRLYGLRMALGEFDADVVYRDLDKYGRRQLTHPEIAHEAATQALVRRKKGGGGARVGAGPGGAVWSITHRSNMCGFGRQARPGRGRGEGRWVIRR